MLSNLLIEDGAVRKEVIGSRVSHAEVAQFFLPWDFLGKYDYMDFLSESNGLFFPDGLCLKSDLYLGLEVETLYDLKGRIERYWAIAKENPDYPEDFTTGHMPIANDAAGNIYWIDLVSGEVLFIDSEYGVPEGLYVVSDSFSSFYSALYPMHCE
jgi:hypothetical protein